MAEFSSDSEDENFNLLEDFIPRPIKLAMDDMVLGAARAAEVLETKVLTVPAIVAEDEQTSQPWNVSRGPLSLPVTTKEPSLLLDSQITPSDPDCSSIPTSAAPTKTRARPTCPSSKIMEIMVEAEDPSASTDKPSGAASEDVVCRPAASDSESDLNLAAVTQFLESLVKKGGPALA